jgi:hypothetical protein
MDNCRTTLLAANSEPRRELRVETVGQLRIYF